MKTKDNSGQMLCNINIFLLHNSEYFLAVESVTCGNKDVVLENDTKNNMDGTCEQTLNPS